jgi:hypothetical protein
MAGGFPLPSEEDGNRQKQFPSIRLRPESIDQSSKRRRLLTPAWVVEEESGERLAPILQYANELRAREMLRSFILPHEARPMPSIAARITISTSSTIKGPLTATDSDFLPFSNSHR